MALNAVRVTADYTVQPEDDIIYVDTSAGNVAITLEDPTTLTVDDREVKVVKVHPSNQVIVSTPAGSIGGISTRYLYSNGDFIVVSGRSAPFATYQLQDYLLLWQDFAMTFGLSGGSTVGVQSNFYCKWMRRGYTVFLLSRSGVTVTSNSVYLAFSLPVPVSAAIHAQASPSVGLGSAFDVGAAEHFMVIHEDGTSGVDTSRASLIRAAYTGWGLSIPTSYAIGLNLAYEVD